MSLFHLSLQLAFAACSHVALSPPLVCIHGHSITLTSRCHIHTMLCSRSALITVRLLPRHSHMTRIAFNESKKAFKAIQSYLAVKKPIANRLTLVQLRRNGCSDPATGSCSLAPSYEPTRNYAGATVRGGKTRATSWTTLTCSRCLYMRVKRRERIRACRVQRA